MEFASKVIVITGAAQGLGKSLAEKLSGEGASLALVDIASESLEELSAKIGGDHIKSYVCDISDAEQVSKCISGIINDFQHIDVLINNAGVWTDDQLETDKPELRKKALEVNVLGHIQVVEECLPYFQKNSAGHIVEVVSTSGVSDLKDGDNSSWKTYGASKWAMRGYINALKKSLENTNIRITSFFPGGFESNLYENANRDNPHQQPWMMATDDVADAVMFCLTRPDDVHVESLVLTKKSNI